MKKAQRELFQKLKPSIVSKENKLVLNRVSSEHEKQLQATLPRFLVDFPGVTNDDHESVGKRDYFYFSTGKIQGAFKKQELELFHTLDSLSGMASLYLGECAYFAEWEKDVLQVGNVIVVVMRMSHVYDYSWAPTFGPMPGSALTS